MVKEKRRGSLDESSSQTRGRLKTIRSEGAQCQDLSLSCTKFGIPISFEVKMLSELLDIQTGKRFKQNI